MTSSDQATTAPAAPRSTPTRWRSRSPAQRRAGRRRPAGQTNEDTQQTITLSASDADGDDPLSFAIATPPAHGSLGAIGA